MSRKPGNQERLGYPRSSHLTAEVRMKEVLYSE